MQKVQRTYMIPADLDQWLDKWCDERKLTKSDVVGAAIEAVRNGGIEMRPRLGVEAIMAPSNSLSD